MIPIRLLFCVLLIAGGVLLILTPVSFAYISDEDIIEGSISTGTWGEQSDGLTIDITGALLTGHGSNGFHLHNIFLTNTGDKPKEITGMAVGWDPNNGEMLQLVHICSATANGGDHFWTGRTCAGSSVEGEHLLGMSDSGNVHCWFDSDMSGKTIFLTFIFDDGSQKGVAVLV